MARTVRSSDLGNIPALVSAIRVNVAVDPSAAERHAKKVLTSVIRTTADGRIARVSLLCMKHGRRCTRLVAAVWWVAPEVLRVPWVSFIAGFSASLFA